MAKKPEIEHEYHANKDTLKITIHGYALKSKASRDTIMKKIMVEVGKSPARQIAYEGKVAKREAKREAKELRRLA